MSKCKFVDAISELITTNGKVDKKIHYQNNQKLPGKVAD